LKRYDNCQQTNGDCSTCSLTNYGKDCHNNPINDFSYCRKRAGLTQQAMSDLLKIPKRTIEDWEGNKHNPPDWVKNLVIDKLKQL